MVKKSQLCIALSVGRIVSLIIAFSSVLSGFLLLANQEVLFRRVKDALLHCKRCPFEV